MLRFTIRDLLSVTLLVAVGCGWWLNSQRWERQNATLQRQNAKLQESERAHAFSLARAAERAADVEFRADIIKDRWRESSRRFKKLRNAVEKAGYRVHVDGEEVTIQLSGEQAGN